MKKVLGIIVNVLAWVILIFALLVTIMVFSSGRNNGVANLMGFIPMTVESDSMKPTFEKDDFIICREIDDMSTLKKNDVITFWTIIEGQKVKNTHRIVEINTEGGTTSYITRGDNNSLDDSIPVYAGDIIGKWTGVKLHGFGKVMSFLRTKTGFFICILIPMAIFFLFELYKFIVTLIEIKKPELSEDDEEEIKRRAIEEYLAAQKEKEGQNSEAAEESKPEAEKAPEPAAEDAGQADTAEKTAESEEKPAEDAEPAAESSGEEKAEEPAENAAPETEADAQAEDTAANEEKTDEDNEPVTGAAEETETTAGSDETEKTTEEKGKDPE